MEVFNYLWAATIWFAVILLLLSIRSYHENGYGFIGVEEDSVKNFLIAVLWGLTWPISLPLMFLYSLYAVLILVLKVMLDLRE